MFIALPGATIAGDLPSTIRKLRQDDNLIRTSRYSDTHCNQIDCITDDESLQIGSLISVLPDGTYQVVCLSGSHALGTFAVKAPEAATAPFELGYEEKTLRQFLEGTPGYETAFDLIQNLLKSGVIEARQVYSQLTIGDRDLRIALSGLQHSCARKAPTGTKIVLERRFATIALLGNIKQNVNFEEFKSSLLKISNILGGRYETKIGSVGGERVLHIETRNPRLFLVRAVSLDDVKKYHPGWIDQIPKR
ncbi:MAG: hypothetical protein GC182_05550 [Rhodopseudomonas sp.]|nr:hypothetical protein [Rhodopseudomonas sp.]